MQRDEQRLRFRDAMASLAAAVNIVTTAGHAGRCGITATAVCSVTDTPPSVIVCINANSAMNPVFQGNGWLCINVLNHEQELMARHFAGMTGMAMEERFHQPCWQNGPLGQPVLNGALAGLEGEISEVQTHWHASGVSGSNQKYYSEPGWTWPDLFQTPFSFGKA